MLFTFVGSMFKAIFYTLAAILLYRFVFRFMIPLMKVTKTATDKVKQMQQQMNDMENRSRKQEKPPTVKEGDYIEYEEVK